MGYQIMVENQKLGSLTEDGIVQSDIPFLQRFSGLLAVVCLVSDNAGTIVTVSPGEKGYLQAMIAELEGAGYVVRPS